MAVIGKKKSRQEHRASMGKLVKGIRSHSPLKKEKMRVIEHIKKSLHTLNISALNLGFLQE